MRRWWFRWLYRLTTDNNARWMLLFWSTVVLFLFSIALIPYALTQPETNYERAARQMYQLAGLRYGGQSMFGGFLRGIAWIVWGLFGITLVATGVYTFFAFGDDARRAVEAIRMRMWDRYGGEIRSRGFLTRLLLGENPPPGSNPPTAPAQPAVATAAGTQPLTRGAFLFWEALIDLAFEIFGHRFLARR